MKIHDITLSISPTLPVWPGDPAIKLELLESMDQGAHANVSALSISAHTGTHVDAPHHFLNNGRTVETLRLDVLCGPALVIQVADSLDAITAEVLDNAGIPAGTERLLIRTRNSNLWRDGVRQFVEDFVAIPAGGAEWLVRQGIRLVGVDYLSVAPYERSEATHQILLKAGVIPIEGLDLHTIPPGEYELFCLPLKLEKADGAPARAVLIER